MTRTLRADAYAPSALTDAGLDPVRVGQVMADTEIPERPRLTLTGRKRGELTTRYVWGPDAMTLLAEETPR